MIHYDIGKAGHLFVIISFVAALISSISYFLFSSSNEVEAAKWKWFARTSFSIHIASVFGVVFCLFYIIYNHFFEYQYAFSHSSKELPIYYMISCFWEGQEGSFLLWMFWNAILGAILIKTNKLWEAPVMTVFALVQAFLTSMILGAVIGDVKLGSSPFILMREANPDIPIFLSNPDFIPKDGKGLNALLQNYWMVIHPPTLFLGFATTLIPFAYCIAGLWKKRFKEWVRPALPWALFSALVLGVGILMGGYWAYETLSFGGYWNWDPVENGVFVPWLVQIAGIHTMIIFRKNNKALMTTIILVIATFLLILYATFITRSGVLGEASVHSFTDLGLSGQLLIYLVFFILVALFFVIIRWNEIPKDNQEVSTYSREFWIFMGATVLCLSSFQILLATSIPVYNKIVQFFGGVSNVAPPADLIAFYNKFQIWVGVLLAIFSGTGQFFWWQKMDKEQLKNAMTLPVVVTLIISSIFIITQKVYDYRFIVLLTASLYSIIANSSIMLKVFRNSPSLSGGSIAHIGIAMMLLGILFSSGYSNIISKNISGITYSKDFGDEMNRDNILLWLNKPEKMADYEITYKGQHIEAKGFPEYIDRNLLHFTGDPKKVVAERDLLHGSKKYFKKGDTVEIYPENTFYKIDYKEANGNTFTLYPRAQINPQMGGLLASPDIKRNLGKDLYTHVSAIVPHDAETKWSAMEEFDVTKGDTFVINDFIAVLETIEPVKEIHGIKMGGSDAAIKAKIRILDFGREYVAEPVFLIKNSMVGRIPDILTDLGLKVSMQNVIPQSNTFKIGINTSQKDYIIMKAIEKPLINILWLGTFLMIIGFCIAIYRRYSEFTKMRDKGVE